MARDYEDRIPWYDITRKSSAINRSRMLEARKEGGAVYFSDYEGMSRIMQTNRSLERIIRRAANTIRTNLKLEISQAETDREKAVGRTIKVRRADNSSRYGGRIAYEVYSDHEDFNFFNMKSPFTWEEFNKRKRAKQGEFLKTRWSDSWTNRAIAKASRML